MVNGAAIWPPARRRQRRVSVGSPSPISAAGHGFKGDNGDAVIVVNNATSAQLGEPDHVVADPGILNCDSDIFIELANRIVDRADVDTAVAEPSANVTSPESSS